MASSPLPATALRASALGVLCLLAASCSRSTLQSSVADQYGGADATQEMDFWDGLAVLPAVSNRDVVHALLLSFGRQPKGARSDWTTELKAAQQRGWIAADADPMPGETARVGMVARVICIEAKIEGGATMRLLGPTERYAVKELNHMRWLPDMSSGQSISGGQLLAVLSKAEDRLSAREDPDPKEDM